MKTEAASTGCWLLPNIYYRRGDTRCDDLINSIGLSAPDAAESRPAPSQKAHNGHGPSCQSAWQRPGQLSAAEERHVSGEPCRDCVSVVTVTVTP